MMLDEVSFQSSRGEASRVTKEEIKHKETIKYISLFVYCYTTLHYTTPHHTTLHYTTLHYTTLHPPIHYNTPHYITPHTTRYLEAAYARAHRVLDIIQVDIVESTLLAVDATTTCAVVE